MKSDLATIPEEASIDEAIRLMTAKQIKRLPVVDAEGQFKGMVSRDSLLRAGIGGSHAPH
jgi:CBS domain-containing protein